MHLKAKKDFSWAHRGVQVEHFAKGQIIETDDEDLVSVSIKEGWAEKAKEPTKAEKKEALKERIAEIEARLADADESQEAAIEAELAEAQAELAAL